jgi:hypothetical protein
MQPTFPAEEKQANDGNSPQKELPLGIKDNNLISGAKFVGALSG